MVGGGGGGAGAELGGGGGAGAELGGASVGGEEPCEPDPPAELDDPEVLGALVELDERAPLAVGVAAWPACAVGCTPGVLARALRWCRWSARAVGDPAEEAETDGSVLRAVLTWLTVWAGAVRANRVAKPTAVTALSCVARQVSLDRRRSPVARAPPGNSSMGPVAGVVMAGEW
jgi:hypothetical protein